MLFYIANLFFVCWGAYILRRKSKILFLFVFIWLSLVGALRGEGIGADYDNYKLYFQYFAERAWFAVETIERGYVWLNKLVALSTDEYQWLLAACGFLSMIGVIYFIKRYSIYPILSIWLYISLGSYQSTFTRLRQAIAISIILIGYRYIIEKKIWKYILCVICAFLFHYSAICTILLYPFYSLISRYKGINLAFTICVCLCGLYLVNLIKPLLIYTGYFYYADADSGEGVGLLLIYSIIYLYILLTSNYKSNKNIYMDILLCFSSFAVIFQSFAPSINILNRASEYFSIPMFLLLPNTLGLIKNKTMAISILLIVSMIFYICIMSNNSQISYSLFISDNL